MAENFEAEQAIVNANTGLISTISGHDNTSYTISNKFPQKEPDGSQVVMAKGNDGKTYQIQVSANAPFILAAKQMVLLD